MSKTRIMLQKQIAFEYCGFRHFRLHPAKPLSCIDPKKSLGVYLLVRRKSTDNGLGLMIIPPKIAAFSYTKWQFLTIWSLLDNA